MAKKRHVNKSTKPEFKKYKGTIWFICQVGRESDIYYKQMFCLWAQISFLHISNESSLHSTRTLQYQSFPLVFGRGGICT